MEEKDAKEREKKHTIFQHLIEMQQVDHNDIAMLLQYGEGDEEVEAAAEEVGPEALPQAQDVGPVELALVPDEQHAEEEEEVGAVGGLEVGVQPGVHELDEVVERAQLVPHPGLVAQEVALHAPHEALEGPERHRVVLQHRVDRRQQIRHPLHVPQLRVVLVVRQEHVLHLLHVHVGAHRRERGLRVRVRDVFPREDGDCSVSSVYVFF